MTPANAGRILVKAAAFDARTIGPEDAIAWAEALDDIDYGDALAAVTRHYRVSTDWLKPAHLRRHVAEIDRERARAAITAAATAQPCPHGQPGGMSLHPATGAPLCALCRAGHTNPKGIAP